MTPKETQTFFVLETTPIQGTLLRRYKVEAESQSEAVNLVMQGKVEAYSEKLEYDILDDSAEFSMDEDDEW